MQNNLTLLTRMVSRITDCLWSNTTWRANSTVYISEGTHKASRVQGCSAVSWEAQRTCKRTATIVPGHNIIWMLCLYSRQNKRPKVGPRREQQTLTIQFLTLLMSNSRFSPLFSNPEVWLLWTPVKRLIQFQWFVSLTWLHKNHRNTII